VDLYVVFAVGFSLYSMAVGEKTILSQGVSQEFFTKFSQQPHVNDITFFNNMHSVILSFHFVSRSVINL
jgi:hypothetical protein